MNIYKKVSFVFILLVCSFVFSSSAGASSEFLSAPDLELGKTNPFVIKLQKFLNNNGYVVNSKLGEPGSIGYESDYFGKLTQKALSVFQTKNSISPASGYFGPKTKNKIGSLSNQPYSVAPSGDLSAYGSETCSSITISGNGYEGTPWSISWTFDRAYTCGHFANGEWWVIGPVTVTNITPKSRDNTNDGQVHDGSMKNPIAGGRQGFDSEAGVVYINGTRRSQLWDYDASFNVSLNLPLTLNAGDVLVTADTINVATAPSDQNHPNFFNTVGALTVLGSVPPEGSFRPAPYGTDRTIKWNKSQIDYSILKNLAPVSGTPSKSYIDSKTPSLPWWEWTENWKGGEFVPWVNVAAVPGGDGYPSTYGREISQKWGEIGLWLNLNNSQSDKERVVIATIQAGIDIQGYVNNGGGFTSDGGHKGGRKFPVLFAGLALNDQSLLNTARTKDLFQEDAQIFTVTQNDVGRTVIYPKETYTQAHVGLPEWGIRHDREPQHDDSRWNEPPYRRVVWPAMLGPTMAIEIMGKRSSWGHEPIFEYNRRFKDISGFGTTFYQNMWNAYIEGTEPPPNDTQTLTVSKSGTAAYGGIVSSNPSGISCGADCTENYSDGTVVTLTATPPTGATFTGWSGVCNGTGSCQVTMSAAKNVTAEFNFSNFSDGQRVTTNATVNVRSTPMIGSNILGQQPVSTLGTVSCSGKTCPSISTDPNVPGGSIAWWWIDFDSGVDGWVGRSGLDSSGNPPTTQYDLTVSKSGTGAGTVSSSPAGISCGSDCSETYNQNTSVTLTANPSTGSTFVGWSGGGCTGTGLSCTVSMSADKTVTATFNTQPQEQLSITSPLNNAVLPANTTQATVTWTGNFSNYLLRAEDKADDSKYVLYDDTYTSNSVDFPVESGHSYLYWMHSGTLSNYSPEVRVEFSVAQGGSNDDDGDGVPNDKDLCPNTAPGTRVNSKGCPFPRMTTFDIAPTTTILDQANFSSFPNFYIGKTGMGKINWGSQPLDLESSASGGQKGSLDLDSLVTIAPKTISINSVSAPQLNAPAILTFYNINFKPKVTKNSESCSTCTNIVYNAKEHTLTVTVTGFSTYSVIEDTDGTPKILSTSTTGPGTIIGNTSPYNSGETATLTAKPNSGASFSSWGGACSGSSPTCEISMLQDATVTAEFKTIGGGGGGGGGGGNSGGNKDKKTPKSLQVSCSISDTTVAPGSSVAVDTTVSNASSTYTLKWSGSATKLPGFDKAKEDQSFLIAKKGTYTLQLQVKDKAGRNAKVICKTIKVDPKYNLVTNPTTGTTQTTSGNTPNSIKYIISKILAPGQTSLDVITLQKFLNSKGFVVSTKGLGSVGNESSYYGELTKQAVKKFQQFMKLTVSGSVDEKTRTAINNY